ncbi:sulfite exporter TauE/SafE family protein [Pseudahrensia aquimaris]|uniref:Probable membrane transporter protein n=1 Tax=Pseudahrensia aquimaris TaxID=744461 RepID=A0ABW3FIR6_9HYPH
MIFEPAIFALCAAVVIMTGISKSGFGAGLEMMAVPVLALTMAPQTAAAIMLPILLVIDFANLVRYRRDWVARVLWSLLPYSIIGIALGAYMFEYTDPSWFKLGLGVLSLAFVAQRLWMAGKVQRKPGPVLTAVLGAMGGFTSFVAHAGSPPIKMVLMSEELPKQQFVGTNSYLFSGINFMKAFPYFFLGQFSMSNLTASASLFPITLMGIALGFWLNGKVSQKLFDYILIGALSIAGVKLIWDGVSELMV